jgi:hypothetical protein
MTTNFNDIAKDPIDSDVQQVAGSLDSKNDSLQENIDTAIQDDGASIVYTEPEKPIEPKDTGIKKTAKDRIDELTWKFRNEEKQKLELSLKIQELEKKFTDLNSNIVTKQTEDRLNQLKEIRKSALENADYDSLNTVDMELIQLMNKNMDTGVKQPNVPIQNEYINNIQSKVVTPDDEAWFKNFNPWYQQDFMATAAAKEIDRELYSDSYWGNQSVRERLKETARRVKEKMENRSSNYSSGVMGVTQSVSNAGNQQVAITQEELRILSKMYPTKSRDDLIKIGVDIKKNNI